MDRHEEDDFFDSLGLVVLMGLGVLVFAAVLVVVLWVGWL